MMNPGLFGKAFFWPQIQATNNAVVDYVNCPHHFDLWIGSGRSFRCRKCGISEQEWWNHVNTFGGFVSNH